MGRIQTTLQMGLACCYALAVIGCETSVDPVIGDERPYTVWGILDIRADTQRVRVFPLSDVPGIDRGSDIDAAVSSTDLNTGEVRIWRHSTRTYEGGSTAHIFWSDFQAIPDHVYRVEIRRSDGAASVATTRVPEVPDIDVSIRSDSGYVPVIVEGDSLNIIGLHTRYEGTNVPPMDSPDNVPIHPAVFHAVEISHQGDGRWTEPGVWTYEIDMYEDASLVFAEYAQNCLVNTENPDIALRRVELRFVIAGPDWKTPSGLFDPDDLVQPNSLSNVENGYGFVGAGEVYRYRWTPTPTVLHQLGFRNIPKEFSEQPPWPCFDKEHTSVWDLFF